MAAPIIYSSPSPYSDSRLLIIRQKEGIGCTIFKRYAATFKQGRKLTQNDLSHFCKCHHNGLSDKTLLLVSYSVMFEIKM